MTTKFGARVKNRLVEMKPPRTQKDLAYAVGLEPPQISRILSGESGTTPQTIVKMANFLGEPVDEYLKLYGNIDPDPDYDPMLNRIITMYNSWSDPNDKYMFLQMAEVITRRRKSGSDGEEEDREFVDKNNQG